MKHLTDYIFENSSNKFYHSIIPARMKKGGTYHLLIRLIYKEGITPNDNGEKGAVIWFGDELHGYNRDLDRVEVCIEYKEPYITKYGLYKDSNQIFAEKPIDLTLDIICAAPWGYYTIDNLILGYLALDDIDGWVDAIKGLTDDNIQIVIFDDIVTHFNLDIVKSIYDLKWVKKDILLR